MDLADLLVRRFQEELHLRMLFPPPIQNPISVYNMPLHRKRGWTQHNNSYTGYYRTQYGAFKGEIVRRGDTFDVFIIDPPLEQLKKHPKWPCIRQAKDDKVKVHLEVPPEDGDIGAIILYIEGLIIESFRKQ